MIRYDFIIGVYLLNQRHLRSILFRLCSIIVFLTLTVCTEKGALKQPKVAENQ